MYGRAPSADQARLKRRIKRFGNGGSNRSPQTGQCGRFVADTSSQWPQTRGRGVLSLGGGYEWKPAPGW